MLSLECRLLILLLLFLPLIMDINKKFGKKLSLLRRDQSLSQEDLAYKCGLHRTYIGALERGEKSPTLKTIEKIAAGLNIELLNLIPETKKNE